jgi:hypothetical protein
MHVDVRYSQSEFGLPEYLSQKRSGSDIINPSKKRQQQ